MASGDMIMKLLLNTADFDGKIGKSKKEVALLGDTGKASLGNFAGFLGKVTAAAGLAMGGMELFNKTLASSQSVTDAWGRNIEVAKSGLDNFLYAVANADFSAFSNGLADMARKAREMYDAYDQLANTVMSANFSTTLDQARYRELMVVARDKSLPQEQRQAALDQAKALGESIAATARKTEKDSMAALASMFAAKTGADASLFTPQMIEEAFRIDARATSAEERAAIEAQYAEYLAEMRKADAISGTRVVSYGFGGVANTEIYGDVNEERRVRREIQARYAEVLTKQLALFRLADEELQNSMNTYVSAVKAINASSKVLTSTNELQTTMNSEAAASAKAATKAAAEAKQIAEQIKAVRDMRGADQTGPAGEFTSPSALGSVPKQVQQGIETEDLYSKYYEIPLLMEAEDKAKEFEKVSSSVDLLSSSFSQLGGTIGGTAGQMLTFVGTTLEAAAAIMPLIAQITAEKMAREANANAATKEATAKVISAHAGIPFAGIALATAGVAAIIGLMKSIPKFADGAVVTSATLGVFGEAGPEAVLPLDRINDYIAPREIRITGEFRTRGKDLVATVGNYEQVRKVK